MSAPAMIRLHPLVVTILITLLGAFRLSAQAEPTPRPTPDDIPAPLAQAPRPTPTPPAVGADCGGGACKECVKTDQSPKKSVDDEATLTKLETDWANAIMHHDVDFLERVEADDYTFTGPDGVVSHKADEIAAARTKSINLESFRHHEIRVCVYGDTAVVFGATTIKGSAGDTDLGGDFRWTDVFVRHGQQWQVVASQATPVHLPVTED